MLDILSIFSGVFLLFIACALCFCCLRCVVWACYDLWHPEEEGSVCESVMILLFMDKGYNFLLLLTYGVLRPILSNRLSIWLATISDFSLSKLPILLADR